MQVLKFSLVAAVMVCALSVTALSVIALPGKAEAADCARITASGETLTHDMSVLFATNALKNTLASQGRIGKGAMRMTCKPGGATETCYASQVACTGGTKKSCLGPWLCF
jgi:hypothetical protein